MLNGSSGTTLLQIRLLLTDEAFPEMAMKLQAGHLSKTAQCVDWTVLNSHRNLT